MNFDGTKNFKLEIFFICIVKLSSNKLFFKELINKNKQRRKEFVLFLN